MRQPLACVCCGRRGYGVGSGANAHQRDQLWVPGESDEADGGGGEQAAEQERLPGDAVRICRCAAQPICTPAEERQRPEHGPEVQERSAAGYGPTQLIDNASDPGSGGRPAPRPSQPVGSDTRRRRVQRDGDPIAARTGRDQQRQPSGRVEPAILGKGQRKAGEQVRRPQPKLAGPQPRSQPEVGREIGQEDIGIDREPVEEQQRRVGEDGKADKAASCQHARSARPTPPRLSRMVRTRRVIAPPPGGAGHSAYSICASNGVASIRRGKSRRCTAPCDVGRVSASAAGSVCSARAVAGTA